MRKTGEPLLAKESETSINVSTTKPEKRSWKGLGLLFVGVLVSTLIQFSVKVLEEDGIPFLQVTFVRWLVTSLLIGASIQYKRWHGDIISFFGPKKYRAILLVRAVLYFTYLCSFYWALMYIAIGLTTIIYFTFPLFTAILFYWDCCNESEKLSKFAWLCTLIGFSGTFCVAYSSRGDNVIGVFLSLAASISYSLQLIVIRRTRVEVHWFQIEFVTACVWSFILTPCVWLGQYVFNTVKHDHDINKIVKFDIEPYKWGYFVCIGVLCTFALGCWTRGFQLEEAPRGSIVAYLEVPITFVAQWILFGLGVTWIELCGVSSCFWDRGYCCGEVFERIGVTVVFSNSEI